MTKTTTKTKLQLSVYQARNGKLIVANFTAGNSGHIELTLEQVNALHIRAQDVDEFDHDDFARAYGCYFTG